MENLFEILATDLKVEKDLIQKAVEKNKIILLDNDKLATLKKTVQDESYNKAHGIAYKNAIKDLAAKFEFEVDATADFDTVKNNFEGKIKEKYGAELEKIKLETAKSKDEKIKDFENRINEFQSSIAKLQTTIKAKEEEVLKEKNTRLYDKAKADFSKNLNLFNVKVPAEIEKLGEEQTKNFIKKQYEIAELMFYNKFDFRFKEDGSYEIISKDKGEVVKDNLENPMPLSNIVTSIVTDYLNVTTNEAKGKGEGDKTNLNSKYNFKNEEELFKHIDSLGVNRTGTEAVAIYTEWIKNKQK